MSLSGNLGFVSLDEVLRLLIRSGQRGCVSVRGSGVDGRVFVTRGGISLATTMTDDGLETLFRKSQLVDPAQIASGNSDGSDAEVIELIREITVESIYRLNLHGEGFDVAEGLEARYGSPRPFELEQTLEASRKRLEDWAEVSQVVSNLDARIAFLRDLGDREEVKIRRDAWKVLSEVGAGASVTQIARELGTTEFWAARVVARLVQDELLRSQPDTTDRPYEAAQTTEPEYQPEPEYHPEPVAQTAVTEPVAPAPVEEAPLSEPEYEYEDVAGSDDHVYSEPYEDAAAEQSMASVDEPIAAEMSQPEPADEAVWQQESQIPGVGAQVEEPDYETAEVPVTEAEDQDEDFDPNRSWWEEPEDEFADTEASEDDEADDGDDVEEDTEAFLEKVFSELDRSDEAEEEGYGLLRRRRLGAMRDIARDS